MKSFFPKSAVYSVTPPGTLSFVPLMYKILVLVDPTHTNSETAEPNGAFVTFPLATSKICHVVDALCVVQLYTAELNRANSFV
jgi:hypothetical protein